MDVLSLALCLILSFLPVQSQPNVPGPVSDLRVLAKFTSVDLTWSAPREPNGVIISYEVTYRITGTLNKINTTDIGTTFSIPSLSPRTTVSGLSVSAYTRIGRGRTATIADQTTLDYSIVNKIRVKSLSPTAVRVTWGSVDIPEIAGYVVYYSEKKRQNEMSVTVTSHTINSVDIRGLSKNVKYQFQVAVLAEVNGEQFVGERDDLKFHAVGSCSRDCGIVIGVIFSYLLIMIVVTIILLYRHRVYLMRNTSKSRNKSITILWRSWPDF